MKHIPEPPPDGIGNSPTLGQEHEQPPSSSSAQSYREAFDSDPLIGTLVGERYRVQHAIGRGGMGTVYLAEHVLMEKQVALKVLHPTLAVVSSVMDRFQKEAVALSRIDHPNVVSATDFGKLENGAFYLALQYIEGRSLADLLEAEGALAPERALAIAHQVGLALSAAHSHRIVHRDLKPHNVMLTATVDNPEVVKVLDFGLAKLRSKRSDESTTSAGSVLGTPHYMAPEQVTGESVDGRADVYSLGVILFEMLTGQRPFEAAEVREIMGQQVTKPPPPLPESIPVEIRAVVEQAMQKRPDDRFQSADELVAAIDQLLRPVMTTSTAPPPAPFLSRPVAIAGFEVPVWGLLLPGGVFLLLFTLGIIRNVAMPDAASEIRPMPDDGPLARPNTPSLAPEPDRWPSLISDAEFGKKEAIEELLRIPPAKRGRDVWLVLGRGQMVRKRTDEALDIYRDAIHQLPELADDESIAKNVRIATSDSRTAQKAVTVAAESMGARGVDILFHVWATTAKRTPASALAERYMAQDKVRKKASPQVQLALALRETEQLECSQVLQLVKNADEYGDTRSIRPLFQLKSREGCGPAKRDDCYPCLRDNKHLAEATKKASKRRAPQF